MNEWIPSTTIKGAPICKNHAVYTHLLSHAAKFKDIQELKSLKSQLQARSKCRSKMKQASIETLSPTH